MAANSKHYGDIILWIDKVIDSCVTNEQLRNAENLIHNFEKLIEHYDMDAEIKRAQFNLKYKALIRLGDIMESNILQKL